MLTYVLLIYAVLRAPRYVRDDDMRPVYLQNQENSRNIHLFILDYMGGPCIEIMIGRRILHHQRTFHRNYTDWTISIGLKKARDGRFS